MVKWKREGDYMEQRSPAGMEKGVCEILLISAMLFCGGYYMPVIKTVFHSATISVALTVTQLKCIKNDLYLFAVGHAALFVHHPSHSQHWRLAEGQEVHRGLWDGGLRDGAPSHPAPPSLQVQQKDQQLISPSNAVPSCRLSSLSWALGSLPLMDLK